MEKAQLKRIFEFLEDKEEQNSPIMWKHMNDMPLTEKDLTIEGDLDLEYRNITSLPEGLKVNGYLNLYGCKYLKSLPKGLEVGDLKLYNTELTSLPEGLKVGGNLSLYKTKITSLPEGLEVGGSFSLVDSKITSLPKGLKVDGYLDLRNTKITSLPEGLKVGDYLDLVRLKITSLPKGLEVGGYLYIYGTNLAKYIDDELIEMVKPGFIKGEIIRK